MEERQRKQSFSLFLFYAGQAFHNGGMDGY